ncbi:uncharacterized protein LOC125376960 [Haliotis rufescens]|uniref:uncharacterized protein LOC125376960 n=1 Tax=Haliotis rufescens TaxID=6454 RepID=UPI00201F7569|nr:uncharacterized protein LOC125376960 [Haliotis rufescens]
MSWYKTVVNVLQMLCFNVLLLVDTEPISCSMQSMPNRDDLNATTGLRWTSVLSARVDCLLRCYDDTLCKSFIHNQLTGICSGFHALPHRIESSNLLNSPGSKWFTMCTELQIVTRRCESTGCPVTASFRTGLCGCGFGRSFDPSTKSCVKSCASYGNEYTQFTGVGLMEHNDLRLYISDPESCEKACSAETSFVCTTAESAYGECRLSPVTWNVVNISALYVHNTANLFQRHCASRP